MASKAPVRASMTDSGGNMSAAWQSYFAGLDTGQGLLAQTGDVKLSYATLDNTTLWLLTDGRAVSRTTYAALFALLGTAYGTGDNSTTFNLPNTTSTSQPKTWIKV